MHLQEKGGGNVQHFLAIKSDRLVTAQSKYCCYNIGINFVLCVLKYFRFDPCKIGYITVDYCTPGFDSVTELSTSHSLARSIGGANFRTRDGITEMRRRREKCCCTYGDRLTNNDKNKTLLWPG